MELYESVRNQQENIINQNKASIIISRTIRVSDGAGGWLENPPVNLPSQDVRIYFKQSRTLVVNEGGWHSERVIKMIAKWDADVESENETFLDTFSYGEKDYKIYDVKDIYTQGQIVFKECQLKEIT
jgi:hypothetical protein